MDVRSRNGGEKRDIGSSRHVAARKIEASQADDRPRASAARFVLRIYDGRMDPNNAVSELDPIGLKSQKIRWLDPQTLTWQASPGQWRNGRRRQFLIL